MTRLFGDASARRPYEVIFYKTFFDHQGHPHHSELMRIAVDQGTKEQAIATATRQFEEMKENNSWNQLANGSYEVARSIRFIASTGNRTWAFTVDHRLNHGADIRQCAS